MPATDNADSLRTPDNACEPDIRNTWFVVHSPEGTRPLTINDRYERVAALRLHAGVPESIKVNFETTLNLYVYSWFVYRFYPIALHYSFVSLEYALRERFEAEIVSGGEAKRDHGPGLRRLLRHAIEGGHLKNENFTIWHHQTEIHARMRTSNEILDKMIREGLSEIEYDEDEFEITDADRNHDMLLGLLDNYPNIRNHFAHGSGSLSNHALGTIQIVSEIINQIFADKNEKPQSHS